MQRKQDQGVPATPCFSTVVLSLANAIGSASYSIDPDGESVHEHTSDEEHNPPQF